MSEKLLSIFEGELERLFSIAELKKILTDYLKVDEKNLPQDSLSKASYIKKVISISKNNYLLPALVEIVFAKKGSMLDPRLKRFKEESYKLRLELEAGESISGKYKVIKELGRGGTGITYLVVGENYEKELALKLYYDEFAFNKARIHSYFASLSILNEFGLKSIPKIVDFGWDQNLGAYLVTEYVKGDKLEDIIKKGGGNDPEFVKHLAIKLIECVEEINAVGFYHGNIKTENIIITSYKNNLPETIVILEPCLDKLIGELHQTEKNFGLLPLIGTPKSMPPEKIKDNVYDLRGDIYSIGIVLFELVTGKPLFVSRTILELLMKHLKEPPPSLTLHISKKDPFIYELDQLIMSMLSKNPSNRPYNLSELKEKVSSLGRKEEEKKTEIDKTNLQQLLDKIRKSPEDTSIIDEIERVVKEEELWREVVVVLEEITNKITNKEEKKNILFRLGRIYEVELKDYEGAERTYKNILKIDPEEMLAEVALEELKKGMGRFEEIIAMLKERISKVESIDEKLALYREIAKIYIESLNNEEGAINTLFEAFKLYPEHEELINELETLTLKTNRWNDLIKLCSELCQDPNRRLSPERTSYLVVRMGYWYDKYLNRPDFALPCYQQALTINPESIPALEGIELIFRKGQQWLELTHILLRKAELIRSPSEKRNILSEVAKIFYEKLNDSVRAIELYETILKEDPTHKEALKLLEKIYAKNEEWEKLLQQYLKKLEVEEDKDELINIYLNIGEIYEDKLKDLDKSIEYYRKALEFDPKLIPALKGLERLYTKLNRFLPLIEILEKEAILSDTVKQKVSIYERIASIYEEEVLDFNKAIEFYKKILEIEPTNLDAIVSLERLYKRTKEWKGLDEIYKRHIELVEETKEKVELYKRYSQLLYSELEDTHKAIEALEKARKIEPTDKEVLNLLARYKQEVKDYEGSINILQEIIKLTEDAKERAILWNRLAQIYEEVLKDIDKAIECYRQALDANPKDGVAISALAELYEKKGDYNATMDMLSRELDIVEGDITKSKIYIKMGKITREKLKEYQRAAMFFEKALELDPSSVEAAEPLAEIRRESGQWEEAAKIYERFSSATKSLPKESALELYEMWTEASIRLKRPEQAIKALKGGLEIDPDNQKLLRKLVELLFKQNRWEELTEYAKEYIKKHLLKDDEKKRGELFYWLGTAKIRLGNKKEGMNNLEKGVEYDPDLIDSWKELSLLYIEEKQWDKAVSSLKRIAQLLAKDVELADQRIESLLKAGEILYEQLNKIDEAEQIFKEVLEIAPDNRKALLKLMQLYNMKKEWTNLVETVLSLAEIEEDPKILAKYYQTAAIINDIELKRPIEALSYYQMALDNDPTLLQSFEAAVRILTDKQNWQELESLYNKVLNRLPEEFDKNVKINMYQALGELYHYRLNNREKAIEIYEKLIELDPENRMLMETLTKLYEDNPRHGDKAIKLHNKLLSLNPFRIESYSWLRRIYNKGGLKDEEWCCTQALVSLHAASQEEEELYYKYKYNDIPEFKDSLTKELWYKYLLHPEEDINITKIFETILPVIAKTISKPHAVFGIDRHQAIDLNQNDHPFTHLVKFISRTLEIEPPELYFIEDDIRGSAYMVTTEPPAMIAEKPALEAISSDDEKIRKGIAFVVAKQLAYTFSGHFVRFFLETGTAMKSWLTAALKYCIPNFPVSQEISAQVSEALSLIKKELKGDSKEILVEQVKTFIETKAEINLKRWARAVDFTTDRIGFLISGDLEITTNAIRIDESETTGIKDRLKEILLFSINEDYFNIRKRLGISIK